MVLYWRRYGRVGGCQIIKNALQVTGVQEIHEFLPVMQWLIKPRLHLENCILNNQFMPDREMKKIIYLSENDIRVSLLLESIMLEDNKRKEKVRKEVKQENVCSTTLGVVNRKKSEN